MVVFLRKQERLWTLASAVTGLLCYALSSSFNYLFGNWNPWKITLYTLLSSITFLVAVLAKDWQRSSILTSLAREWQRFRIFRFRYVIQFLVMLSTTVFSFFSDRTTVRAATKPDAYSVVSSVAFSAMSLSLSRNVPFIFEELLYFFMGIFIAQMMKIKLELGFSVGIVVSFLFEILHSVVEDAHHDPTEIVGIQGQHLQVAIIDVASLQASGENHAIGNNTGAAPSTVQPPPETDERCKQAGLDHEMMNASPRFSYTMDSKKEEEREYVVRKIQNEAAEIRAWYLSERETTAHAKALHNVCRLRRHRTY